MKIIRGIDKSNFDVKSTVVVGTFDGVHAGHRKIIEFLNSLKSAKGLRSVIVTFEPHPQIVLRNRAKDIKILSTTDEKLEEFERLGIDVVYIIKFDKEFSKTGAEEFFKNYLIGQIGLTDLVLGYDHMFGKNREGNYETLKVLSDKYGFGIHKIDEYKLNGDHVNSTTIRHFLDEGNVEKATFLLGRDYNFRGKVVYGDKRGRTIGFPTANLEPDNENKLIPKNGVYLASAELEGKRYNGMMNIGVRPTVGGTGRTYNEVHLFNFDSDIYGKYLRVFFKEFLREEKRFDSVSALVEQLNLDKENCIKKLNYKP